MKIYFLLFLTFISIEGFSQSDSVYIKTQGSLEDSLIPYMGAVTKDVDFPGGYANYINKEIYNYISIKKNP